MAPFFDFLFGSDEEQPKVAPILTDIKSSGSTAKKPASSAVPISSQGSTIFNLPQAQTAPQNVATVPLPPKPIRKATTVEKGLGELATGYLGGLFNIAGGARSVDDEEVELARIAMKAGDTGGARTLLSQYQERKNHDRFNDPMAFINLSDEYYPPSKVEELWRGIAHGVGEFTPTALLTGPTGVSKKAGVTAVEGLVKYGMGALEKASIKNVPRIAKGIELLAREAVETGVFSALRSQTPQEFKQNAVTDYITMFPSIAAFHGGSALLKKGGNALMEFLSRAGAKNFDFTQARFKAFLEGAKDAEIEEIWSTMPTESKAILLQSRLDESAFLQSKTPSNVFADLRRSSNLNPEDSAQRKPTPGEEIQPLLGEGRIESTLSDKTPLGQAQRTQQRIKEGAQKATKQSLEKSSLQDTIKSHEDLTVKDKVNILDYVKTPESVLKKIGLGEHATALRNSYEGYLKELPKNLEKITSWSKRVSKEGNVKIFRFLDGRFEFKDLSKEEQKVAMEVKSWLKEWADRLGLPEDNRIAEYITHIFERDFIKKEFDPELAKIIQDQVPGSVYDPFLLKRLGKLGYIEDTWRALDAYVKRGTRKAHMDPVLEQVRRAANKLDVESYDYVQKHISGINFRPDKLENLTDNFLKSLPGFGYKLGQRPTFSILQTLRRITYRATLGMNFRSVLLNATQGVNTYAELGEKYTTIGYLKFFQSLANKSKELEESGVILENFIQERQMSSIKKFWQNVDDGIFKVWNFVERLNRGAAYFGAKSKGMVEGMSEKEAIDYAKDIVRKTQFSFLPTDVPVALNNQLVKTLAQYQSFSIKQLEFLANKAKNKELAGLARYMIGSIVIAETLGKIIGIDAKDFIPLYRTMTENERKQGVKKSLPPSLQPVGTAINYITGTTDQYGRPVTAKDIFLDLVRGYVPAGTQIVKSGEGLQILLGGGDVKSKSGKTTNFKVNTKDPVNDVLLLLFGKYGTKEGKEYIKELEERSNAKTWQTKAKKMALNKIEEIFGLKPKESSTPVSPTKKKKVSKKKTP